MGSVFEYPFRARTDECDSLGHVNNAVYFRHLQQATFDALGSVDEDTFWNTRKLAIQYHGPVRYGDEVRIATWVIDADDSLVVSGHEVTLRGKIAPVVSDRMGLPRPINWPSAPRSRELHRPGRGSCVGAAQAVRATAG